MATAEEHREPQQRAASRISPRRTSDEAERLRPTRASSAAGSEGQAGRLTARVRRAVREFLLLPAVVVLGYAVTGAASIALDHNPPPWLHGTQHTLSHLISKSAASALLSAIATSVVTVTSITFSVLLLAVQQTASSMTPAVFDQFLRRRTNQLYLGMFVGLALYSFLVLSSIGDQGATFGATVALALTVASFIALIVLIYSTVDQMRPTSVTQAIHDRALNARLAELPLLNRTRRRSEGHGPVHVPVHADQDGYVTRIDVEAIGHELPDGTGAEVVLDVTLGDHVAFGQRLALVIDDEEARSKRVAEAIRRGLQLDRERDLDRDASFAVEQLGNIAWTAISTAKHNPQTGREAVDRLRDLAARWSVRSEAMPERADVLPIVYRDADVAHVLDTLLALVVAARESRQVETAAHILSALSDGIAAVRTEELRAFEPALVRVLSTVEAHPLTRSLETSLEHLVAVLEDVGGERAATAAAELLQTLGRGSRAGK